jgi:hypothetical protein
MPYTITIPTIYASDESGQALPSLSSGMVPIADYPDVFLGNVRHVNTVALNGNVAANYNGGNNSYGADSGATVTFGLYVNGFLFYVNSQSLTLTSWGSPPAKSPVTNEVGFAMFEDLNNPIILRPADQLSVQLILSGYDGVVYPTDVGGGTYAFGIQLIIAAIQGALYYEDMAGN